jgi:branched-chain amino acid transport system permease protein
VALLLSELINGLVLACMLGLVAAGLALIFGVVGIVNFAHGDYVMVGGYILYECYAVLHWPYLVAVIATVAGTAMLGAITYLIALRHLIPRPWHTQLLATLALSILLQNIAQKIWSPSARSVATPFTVRSYRLGSLTVISQQELFIWLGTAVALCAVWLVLSKSKSGKAMRAVSQNREACTVVGISAGRTALLAFTIGTALCGVAAALVLPMQNVYPTAGLPITTQAFVVVILGGMGSLRGAVSAALVIGLVSALSAGYISTGYTDAICYATMILVLVFRPAGLFGDRSQVSWVGL